jgi:hypothetical protein
MPIMRERREHLFGGSLLHAFSATTLQEAIAGYSFDFTTVYEYNQDTFVPSTK